MVKKAWKKDEGVGERGYSSEDGLLGTNLGRG